MATIKITELPVKPLNELDDTDYLIWHSSNSGISGRTTANNLFNFIEDRIVILPEANTALIDSNTEVVVSSNSSLQRTNLDAIGDFVTNRIWTYDTHAFSDLSVNDKILIQDFETAESRIVTLERLKDYFETTQRVYDTISDFINANTLSDDVTSVRISGYGAAGDGGEMLLVKTGTEPSHSAYFTRVDGTFWENKSPYFTPEMFEDLSNTQVDTTTAIQEAFDAAADAGVNRVLLNSRTYLYSNTITLTERHTDLSIIGAGQNSTILKATANSAYFLGQANSASSTANVARIRLRGIKFDANEISEKCVTIPLTSAGKDTKAGNWVIDDCWAFNIAGSNNETGVGFYFGPNADNFTIVNSKVSNPYTSNSQIEAGIRIDTVGQIIDCNLGGFHGWGLKVSATDEANGAPSEADCGRVSVVATRFNSNVLGWVNHDCNGRKADNQAVVLSACYFENVGLLGAFQPALGGGIGFRAANKSAIILEAGCKVELNYPMAAFWLENESIIDYRAGRMGFRGAQPESAAALGADSAAIIFYTDGTDNSMIMNGFTFREEDGNIGTEINFSDPRADQLGGYFTGAYGDFRVAYSMPQKGKWFLNTPAGHTIKKWDGTDHSDWTATRGTKAYATADGDYLTEGSSIKFTGDGTSTNFMIYETKLPEYLNKMIQFRAVIKYKASMVASNINISMSIRPGTGANTGMAWNKEGGYGMVTLNAAANVAEDQWYYIEDAAFIHDPDELIQFRIMSNGNGGGGSQDEIYIDRIEIRSFDGDYS